MRLGRVLLVGRAVADVRAHGDERRPVRSRPWPRRWPRRWPSRSLPSGTDLRVPAVGVEARHASSVKASSVRAVERDAVVVVEDDELAQAEMAGQRGGLGGHALHEVAVAGDGVGVVVDDGREPASLKVAARNASAMAMPTALPKPCPSGPVVVSTPGASPILGMARRAAAELAEVLEVVEGEAVAGEVQQRVEQHAAVAGGEDEAVAVGPVGMGGVVLEVPGPEHVRHGRHAHRHARMARVGLLHGVDGQEADGVDAGLLEGRGRVWALKAHRASLSQLVVGAWSGRGGPAAAPPTQFESLPLFKDCPAASDVETGQKWRHGRRRAGGGLRAGRRGRSAAQRGREDGYWREKAGG